MRAYAASIRAKKGKWVVTRIARSDVDNIVERAKKSIHLTWRQRLWVRLLSNAELNYLHYAMRMLLEYPGVANGPQGLAIEYLTDRLMTEQARRL